MTTVWICSSRSPSRIQRVGDLGLQEERDKHRVREFRYFWGGGIVTAVLKLYPQEEDLLLSFRSGAPSTMPAFLGAFRHMNSVCFYLPESCPRQVIVKYFSVSSPGDTRTSERDRKEPFIFPS